jgi:hypothetical protein
MLGWSWELPRRRGGGVGDKRVGEKWDASVHGGEAISAAEAISADTEAISA